MQLNARARGTCREQVRVGTDCVASSKKDSFGSAAHTTIPASAAASIRSIPALYPSSYMPLAHRMYKRSTRSAQVKVQLLALLLAATTATAPHTA